MTPPAAEGILGMTGMGAARGDTEVGALAVEIRTVNGRNFGCKMRLPSDLSGCEADLETLLRAAIRRGNVLATLEITATGPAQRLLDERLAAAAALELAALAKQLGVPEDVSLTTLLTIPGVVRGREAKEARVSWPLPERVRVLVTAALGDLLAHRRHEGEATVRVMLEDLARIDAELQNVRSRWPDLVAEHRARLLARVQEYLATRATALEPKDVLREVALFADKADVGEEIQRLATHVAKARSVLAGGREVGRTLDFLLQEMLREANTLGSKVPDTAIAHAVVAMKLAVERLKEQAQNLE